MKKNESAPFPNLNDLKEAFQFDDASGCVWLEGQRMLLFHAAALDALRNELIESLGLDRAKGVLMRMGYQSGKQDAQLARKLRPGATDCELFAVGPQLHTLEGIVRVEPIKLTLDIEAGEHYGEFNWINSFEAEQHLNRYGIHSEPVCWNQIGYACGYSSELMGKPIIYKEVECVGCGQETCRIIGKPAEEWEDAEQLAAYFSQGSLAETLFNLKDEVQNLRNAIKKEVEPQDIIGQSPAIRETLHMLEKASNTNVTVLMLGETGVGKDTYARLLHRMNENSDKPFVQVNCSALPADLVEAELFGVEKGAYTGAEKSRPGRFERAHGGTLFLDEIGEMNIAVQAKLLRVLQTGEFERVGDTRTRKVKVRLITATNQPLEERVNQGLFRADLFYRINVFPINIPPLRERKEDIQGLVDRFVGMFNAEYGKNVMGIDESLFAQFQQYDWPGNIRELENIIERGVILTDNGKLIDTSYINLDPIVSSPDASTSIEKNTTSFTTATQILAAMQENEVGLEEIEQQLLDTALEQAEGNISAASRALNISSAKYRYRIQKNKE
ncbi:MAG: sigma 54-interacting transcriptional regulator [Gammaproteobacteria bacterium]